MLNRRTLRIKAMQAIYAYMQAEGSDYNLALDQIEAAFMPDLNSMQVQDRKKLEGQTKIATILFKEWYNTRQFDAEEADKEIRDVVNNAIRYYETQLKKDFKLYGSQMVHAVEKIYDHYLSLLQINEVLVRLIEGEEEKKATRFTEKKELNFKNFLRNGVLQKLLANKSYQERIIRRNISWGSNLDQVRQWYRTVFKADETVAAYVQQPQHTYDEDHELIKHIYKELVFKDETLQKYFEEQDMNWAENKQIVKSLVNKTIKLLEETADENLPLLDLSANWEDDKVFFEDLYNQTIQENATYEALITTHVKNWDVERVALLDKIILKMALCEMHIFRSIPVKVTINEYIEISKLYSTPKSKQFINGVLDKIAQELTDKGNIRKSGRGLIDNK
ncbi:transcription antitermination factor NusB [Adhaeribacter pallidiroseus]|uniref:N utilization substance protein B like protein n=1 Tax=Adhaeribacter pallidiroseus TaxID=2072847 RepID=A0A369QCW6_9BACT|nr:transcription antitermination factor NusB [Adhaeribacter pallidiroseus]RDC62272.1 N utilization substance protein B like protein [Adhaeribacter pallidiroseus]